jgi:hypothetical protein
MELRVSAIDVKKFSVSRRSRTFVAEASDLRGFNLEQRIYDDAMDVGFALWNVHTGAVVRFAHYSDQHDNEGDLQVSYYKPTPEAIRKYPQLEGWTIHILND